MIQLSTLALFQVSLASDICTTVDDCNIDTAGILCIIASILWAGAGCATLALQKTPGPVLNAYAKVIGGKAATTITNPDGSKNVSETPTKATPNTTDTDPDESETDTTDTDPDESEIVSEIMKSLPIVSDIMKSLPVSSLRTLMDQKPRPPLKSLPVPPVRILIDQRSYRRSEVTPGVTVTNTDGSKIGSETTAEVTPGTTGTNPDGSEIGSEITEVTPGISPLRNRIDQRSARYSRKSPYPLPPYMYIRTSVRPIDAGIQDMLPSVPVLTSSTRSRTSAVIAPQTSQHEQDLLR
jgi:hypothetical protein